VTCISYTIRYISYERGTLSQLIFHSQRKLSVAKFECLSLCPCSASPNKFHEIQSCSSASFCRILLTDEPGRSQTVKRPTVCSDCTGISLSSPHLDNRALETKKVKDSCWCSLSKARSAHIQVCSTRPLSSLLQM